MNRPNFFKWIAFTVVCWIAHVILEVADYCVGVYNQFKYKRG